MKKNWFKIIILSILLFSCLTGIVYADNLSDAFKVDDGSGTDPLDAASKKAGYDITPRTDHLLYNISIVIQIGLSFLGVSFILLMIYGGFMWMSDQGNEEQVAKAKKIITAAVIGLVIVISAYAISWFVLNVFSNTNPQ